MIPLRDDNPTRRMPAATIALIAANLLVFAYQLTLSEEAGTRFALGLGMIPAVLFGNADLPPSLALVPAWFSVFTSMFLHGGLLHVAGNMLYLWVFGNNIEDAMGSGRFVAFYALCGVAAALTQGAISPTSEIPMIGASGAISGVLGAYLVLHPRAQVQTFVFIRLFWLPAMYVLGWWAVVQFANASLADPEDGGVAWFAHIGGFVAGLGLIVLFKRPEIGLWGGRTPSGPWG
ncbi:MAG: rhomboid family intramembrane serine protease [Rhodospirillales bacterium]|nr:rhomboid family intramembrane serine protease [Rhodospirillales bacterium]